MSPGADTPWSSEHRLAHELLGQLAARKETFKNNPLTVGQMGELIDLVQSKTITGMSARPLYIPSNSCTTLGTSAKALLRQMLTDRSISMPSKIAEQLQLLALSSTPSHGTSELSPSPALESLCAEAISAMPEEVGAIRRGRKNVVNKLVGRVMRSSRGRADATAVKELLEKMILG